MEEARGINPFSWECVKQWQRKGKNSEQPLLVEWEPAKACPVTWCFLQEERVWRWLLPVWGPSVEPRPPMPWERPKGDVGHTTLPQPWVKPGRLPWPEPAPYRTGLPTAQFSTWSNVHSVKPTQMVGLWGIQSTCVCSTVVFPAGLVVKNPPAKAGDAGSIPGSGRSPGGRTWQPTPVFLPEKFHGQKSLVNYSLWGCKKSDTTEHTHAYTHMCTGSLGLVLEQGRRKYGQNVSRSRN